MNPAKKAQLLAKYKEEYKKIFGLHTFNLDVELEIVGGKLYVFASELNCLRLYHYFNGKGRAEWSENLKTFFYTPDTYLSEELKGTVWFDEEKAL